MNNIKKRLRTKIPRQTRPHSLIRKRRIGIINLNRGAPSARCRRIRKKLRVAAFLQRHEPEDCLLNGLADSQQAVVLEKRCFLGA